ncbi:hypothetical protein LTR48_006470, partial [Friedmanniomyces endolithicus]
PMVPTRPGVGVRPISADSIVVPRSRISARGVSRLQTPMFAGFTSLWMNPAAWRAPMPLMVCRN